MSIIVNTTVLSNFAAIAQLDLLRRLYGHIYIPTEVYQEIRASLEEGYRFYQGIDRLIHPLAELTITLSSSFTTERRVGV